MHLKCMSTSRGLNENGPNGVIHLNALLSIGGIAWKRLGSKTFVGGCVSWDLCLEVSKVYPMPSHVLSFCLVPED